jgi:RNA polymerase sigma-70 factor (ECF subfamily)
MGPLHVLSTSPEVRDEELVDAVVAGDRRAASLLYTRHAERVRRVLARIVGVGPDLDDLVQDSFVTALRRIGALKDRRALSSWLCAVAVGCARHHLRARARKRWLTFFAPESLPEVPKTPALVDGTRDAARAATAVLASLPVDLRIAFALRRVDGLALEEAAAMTGVSLATFKRRMQKADALFAERAREQPTLSAYVDGGAP